MEPSKPASKRLVMTSVNQIIFLVRNNPILADKIPKLANLGQMSLSEAPKKSCNCGGKQNITTPDVNKQVAESTLSSLVTDDFIQIKNVLGLEELCYYKRSSDQSKLELICV
jgi:hypothetical protein